VGLFHNLPFVAEPSSATQSSAMAKEEGEAEPTATPDVLQLFSADKYNYVGRVRASGPAAGAPPGRRCSSRRCGSPQGFLHTKLAARLAAGWEGAALRRRPGPRCPGRSPLTPRAPRRRLPLCRCAW
jgi:hypothetical protein